MCSPVLIITILGVLNQDSFFKTRALGADAARGLDGKRAQKNVSLITLDMKHKF